MSFIDLIGICGVALILVSFFFCQTGRWAHDSYPYLYANLIGSILVMISLYFYWNLSSVIIECFWMLISIYGLIKRQYSIDTNIQKEV